MPFVTPTVPNQVDYTSFLRETVGIATAFLPDDAPIIPTTLAVAQAFVSGYLAQANATIYTWAVYNLGADRLINFAPDVNGQTYFRDLREKLSINVASLGVVTSSGNQAANTSLLNPEQMRRFTLRDLQMLKTPYGREYMGIAQAHGPLWGLT